MYGAMLGDIIGSPYEFKTIKTKDFPLFTDPLHFTDDTVMTFAVCNGLLAEELNEENDEVIKNSLIKSMQAWGKAYPHAGYGRRFKLWLYQDNPKPLNSFGNGSAMRVSPVGWLYDSLERTEHIAYLTAVVSHNHIEGITAAQAVASAIFLARNGSSKDMIKSYITKKYGYDLDRKLDDIRPLYTHNERSSQSVPESIICFLEGNDFEDTVRNAVSLGGDADTQACIAGSIAEAYWGIPSPLIDKASSMMNKFMKEVIDCFNENKKGRMER